MKQKIFHNFDKTPATTTENKLKISYYNRGNRLFGTMMYINADIKNCSFMDFANSEMVAVTSTLNLPNSIVYCNTNL